jgi:enoyl-CoA hydratase/carnithine racemase
MPESVASSVADGVCRIVIDRRPSLAWDLSTVTAVVDSLVQADADDQVRVVVLSSIGDAFCLGGEIGSPSPGVSVAVHRRRYANSFGELSSVLRSLRVPTIARVHGAANAGGLAAVAACDVAVASTDAPVATPEINGGAFPLLAMAMLHDHLRPKDAFRLFYSGTAVPPAEAVRLGIYTQVVEPDELDSVVDSWAGRLRDADGRVVAAARRAYWSMLGRSPSEKMEHGGATLLELLRPDHSPPDQSYMHRVGRSDDTRSG